MRGDPLENMDLPLKIQDIYKSCSAEEQNILLQILKEFADNGDSYTYHNIWLADYKEFPVSIDTFLDSDVYLGKATREGTAVYPYWRETMENIFNAGNRYDEIALTGATRIGKTSTAINIAAYMLHRLMCLRDPQLFFGKKEISTFSLLFFNITKDLARGVAYQEFMSTLQASPWFNSHGKFSKSEQNPVYIPDGGKIAITYGSDASHALGQQVFCAIMDECNFARSGIKDVNKAKERMMDTYNTISARIKGTFRKGGEVYGKLISVSSKKSDSDFMEDYITRQKASGAGDHIYICDRPQWEVLPPSMFHDETFTIAVGDRHRKGFVVNNEDPAALKELEDQGYMLMHPPIDMRPEFIGDFEIALRDLAGISVPGALSFITQDSLTSCIGERQNPFINDIIQIGTKDSYTLEQFFHMDLVPPNLKKAPMYIHLDLSLTTDRTGIGASSITGRKDVEIESGKITSLPFFSHMFSVALQAPAGDKIPYSKIIAFICWLRKSGFNIKCISRDQYQSEYLAQLLEEQGFKSPKISLDRTPDGYIALRSVLLEQRVDMLDCKLLQDELIHLQRDSITGRVDHPVGGCFTGDTKIKLVDGRSLSILELMQEQEYRQNWVYTVNEKIHRIEPKPIKKVFKTKEVDKLLEIVLGSGKVIYCTLDHPFMLYDGSFVDAQNLELNQRLMSLDLSYMEYIKSKTIINKECAVYDLEIVDNHNFALDAGVFVHNSKDIADGFAGSIWQAMLDNPGIPVPAKTVTRVISSVNGPRRNTPTMGRFSPMNPNIHKY